jgi:hypothetical protein
VKKATWVLAAQKVQQGNKVLRATKVTREKKAMSVREDLLALLGQPVWQVLAANSPKQPTAIQFAAKMVVSRSQNFTPK